MTAMPVSSKPPAPNAANAAPPVALPDWAETIRQKYLAGEASLFILHGNVFDKYWVGGTPYSLQDFLAGVLFANNKQVILELSLGQGLVPLKQDRDSGLPNLRQQRDDSGVAGLLDVVEGQIATGRSLALIVPYASTMLPNGDPQFMSVDEPLTMRLWPVLRAPHPMSPIEMRSFDPITLAYDTALMAPAVVAPIKLRRFNSLDIFTFAGVILASNHAYWNKDSC